MSADIDRDPALMSHEGHTEPIGNYRGAAPLAPGLQVTVGLAEERWEVLRIDADEGVFHLDRG